MKAKVRIRIIFSVLGFLSVGLPLLFLTAPDSFHFEPEHIAVSFVENLATAHFDEARTLATPESAEAIELFEVLVGSQATELQNTPVTFTVSHAKMNEAEDTLHLHGKLSLMQSNKLLRELELTLVRQEKIWVVDYRENLLY